MRAPVTALLCALACAGLAAEPSVEIAWTAPLTMADGSVPARIAGYRLYWGTSTFRRYYHGSVLIADPLATGATLDGLPTGLTFFTVTAVSPEGNDSEFSVEVSKTITAPPVTLRRPALSFVP